MRELYGDWDPVVWAKVDIDMEGRSLIRREQRTTVQC